MNRRSVAAVVLVAMLLSIVVAASAAFAATEPGVPLLRFPTIHGDRVVFVHGEDIWSVPASGGVASRLTLHDGQERFPRFSPDGERIAFLSNRAGKHGIWIAPASGDGARPA